MICRRTLLLNNYTFFSDQRGHHITTLNLNLYLYFSYSNHNIILWYLNQLTSYSLIPFHSLSLSHNSHLLNHSLPLVTHSFTHLFILTISLTHTTHTSLTHNLIRSPIHHHPSIILILPLPFLLFYTQSKANFRKIKSNIFEIFFYFHLYIYIYLFLKFQILTLIFISNKLLRIFHRLPHILIINNNFKENRL